MSAGERPRLLALDGSLRRQLSRWFDTGLLSPCSASTGTRRRRSSTTRPPDRARARPHVWPAGATCARGWRRRAGDACVHPPVHGGRAARTPVQVALAGRGAARPPRRPRCRRRPGPARRRRRQRRQPEGCSGADARRRAAADGRVLPSISSPFVGLRGVPLGRLLIKQVAAALSRQSPELAPLSRSRPSRASNAVLRGRLAAADDAAPAANGVALDVAMGELRAAMAAAAVDDDALWSAPPPPRRRTRRQKRLCALYLCTVKRGGGGGGGGPPPPRSPPSTCATARRCSRCGRRRTRRSAGCASAPG